MLDTTQKKAIATHVKSGDTAALKAYLIEQGLTIQNIADENIEFNQPLLFVAIAAGQLDMMNFLLSEGVDAKTKNPTGEAAISYAFGMLTTCEQAQKQVFHTMVLRLIENKGYDHSFGSDPTNTDTLLHGAVRENFPAIAAAIISKHPDALEQTDSIGRKPMQLASETFKAQIESDSPTDVVTPQQTVPTSTATAVSESLLSYQQRKTIATHVKSGDTAALKAYLIEQGLTIQNIADENIEFNQPLLFVAIAAGQLDMMNFLLSEGVDAKTKNPTGEAAISYAFGMLTTCEQAQKQVFHTMVLRLIENKGYDHSFGSDPTNTDTLLHGAVRENFPAIAAAIISKHPDALKQTDSIGREPETNGERFKISPYTKMLTDLYQSESLMFKLFRPAALEHRQLISGPYMDKHGGRYPAESPRFNLQGISVLNCLESCLIEPSRENIRLLMQSIVGDDQKFIDSYQLMPVVAEIVKDMAPGPEKIVVTAAILQAKMGSNLALKYDQMRAQSGKRGSFFDFFKTKGKTGSFFGKNKGRDAQVQRLQTAYNDFTQNPNPDSMDAFKTVLEDTRQSIGSEKFNMKKSSLLEMCDEMLETLEDFAEPEKDSSMDLSSP